MNAGSITTGTRGQSVAKCLQLL